MGEDITRDEFESLISEFESFRDTIMDEFMDLKADVEQIKDEFKEIKDKLAERNYRLSKDQNTL